MKLIYNSIFLEHDTGSHPENKQRLESLGGLNETSLEFAEQDLTLVHTPDYIQQIKEASIRGLSLDPDTITSKQSYEAAVYAVGANLMASRQGDFAIVRPPGHHAFPTRASGFCLFNNIAIAAQKLVNEGKRVMILDIDSHLGDGTEKIFYFTDKVLYWSLHQYPAFPGWGVESEIGAGKGEGFTINVPLPPGAADDVFLKAMDELMCVADQFKPDVVAVSAGFDGHQYDFLLNLCLSADVYYRIGRRLSDRFDHIFATLEGGYNIEYLPGCVFNFLHGINQTEIYYKEQPTQSQTMIRDEFEQRLGSLKYHLSKFWKF